MRVNLSTGLLEGARYVPSLNCDDRPDGEISLLVIHGISLPPGEFGGPFIEEFFTNCLQSSAHPFFEEICTMQVSSHLLIRRDGEVVQFVPFHRRAWHAGASCYDGRSRCNDFSIGIELEGADDVEYTRAQYDHLAQVVSVLMQAYPLIRTERIVGHCDIAPGRKTDPGPSFDWGHLRRRLSVA